MVKFLDVPVDDIPWERQGRRGRVSYPILKSFLETRKICVILDRTGMQQSFQGLYSCLRSYITTHEMPIKIFSSDGEIYLMRLDIDKDGNDIENWKEEQTTEGAAGAEKNVASEPVTAAVAKTRKKTEKKKTTK